MKTKLIVLTTALVLGVAGNAFAQAEDVNGTSMYIPNYSNGQNAFAQQAPARVRQPARTITDSERVWLERSSKDVGAY